VTIYKKNWWTSFAIIPQIVNCTMNPLLNTYANKPNKSSTGYRLSTTDKRNIPLLQYPCQWDVVTRETGVTKEKLLINRANV
jgi:hypothetical protein